MVKIPILALLSCVVLCHILAPLCGVRAEEQPDPRVLASHIQWRALGHYPKTKGEALKSAIDDPAFFLHPEGKRDPVGELQSTIDAFESDSILKNGERARCRFRARYEWLRQQGYSHLPVDPNCAEFDRWVAEIAPAEATLVFSSSYLNNPASMFGHTFLRFDPVEGRAYAPLVSYAVNFSAQTFGEPGLIYAVKGVFGGYVGRFGVGPYYELVRKYNAYENRDLFEYPLKLSPEELRRMVLHVWELRGIGIDYYYFDENCSYHLLSLLEVARPTVTLMDRFSLWALPSDTVKITRAEMMLDGWVPVYRPSRSAELLALEHIVWEKYGVDAVRRAKLIGDGKVAFEGEQPEVLDLAFAYLEYRKVQRKVDEGGETAKRLRAILVERSTLPSTSLPVVPSPSIAPDRGHGSSRVRLIGGSRDGKGGAQVAWGLAVHDLLDPVGGYIPGAALDLGRFVASVSDRGVARIEEAVFVDAASFSPMSELLRPLSWKLYVGANRSLNRRNEAPLRPTVEGGVGRTLVVSESLRLYGLIALHAGHAPEIKESIRLGTGGEVGLLRQSHEGVSFLLSGKVESLLLDEGRVSSEIRGKLSHPISSSVGIYLEGKRQERFDRVRYEGGGGLTFYW